MQLLAARRNAGLTQTEVARRMGTKHSSISRVESGRARATIDFLERYARALGAPITVTFGEPVTPDFPERWARARSAFRRIRIINGKLKPPDARRVGLKEGASFDVDWMYEFAVPFIAHSKDPLALPSLTTPNNLDWPVALASIWYDRIDWERMRRRFSTDRQAWRTDIRVRRKVRGILAARAP